MLKIGLFVLFNCILPFTDMGTDFLTFLDLLQDGHTMWATLTFALMWNSFLIHLGAFLFEAVKALLYKKEFDAWRGLRKVLIHVPFLLPIRNLYNAFRLYQLNFGSPKFQDRDWITVEEIQHEAGIASMYESFTEAGPQSVVQLVVIFSTGRISPAQWFSIPSSLLSLSWASSRAFFIQRGRDEADPDPDMMTVLLRVFPWMFLMVAKSVIMWTLIGGLLGEFIFLGLAFCFSSVLLALHFLQKKYSNTEEGEKISEDTDQNPGSNEEKDIQVKVRPLPLLTVGEGRCFGC